MRKTIATTLLALATACMLLAARESLAQGGPPMVTDDPETPGDGKWEIRLLATSLLGSSCGRGNFGDDCRFTVDFLNAGSSTIHQWQDEIE